MGTAVIGATGRVGSEIVRGLLERGDAVAALVRDPGKARRAFAALSRPALSHPRFRISAAGTAYEPGQPAA